MSLIKDEASLLFAQSLALVCMGGFPLKISKLLMPSGLLQLQPHLGAVCWVELLLLMAPMLPYTGEADAEELLVDAKLTGPLLFS